MENCKSPEIKKSTVMSESLDKLENLNTILHDIQTLINNVSTEMYGPPDKDEACGEARGCRSGRSGAVLDYLDGATYNAGEIRNTLTVLFDRLV